MTSQDRAVTKDPPEKETKPQLEEVPDKLNGSGSVDESSRNLSLEISKPGNKSTDNSAAKTAEKPGETKSKELGSILLGKVEITELPEKKPALKPEALQKAATEVKDAINNRALSGWGWAKPDAEKLRNILEPMSQADRKALEKEYEQQTGHKLKDDLKEKLGGSSENYLKLESILNRQDGKSDEAGQIKTALSKLEKAAASLDSRTGVFNTVTDLISPGKLAAGLYKDSVDARAKSDAEADIRKTIGSLNSEQIKELKDTYKQNYGVDLEAQLKSNPALSQETKAALNVLFKGVDKRSGNDPESLKNTQELVRIGLSCANVDIFKDAMQNAAPEVRNDFARSGGMANLDRTFSGDNLELARSYAERGSADIGHLLEGNKHWYHTNRDEITRLVTQQATDQDRQQYSRGKQLSEFVKNNPDQEAKLFEKDTKDMAFYKRIHDVISTAGSKREGELWEAKLLKSATVITDALSAHNDGSWFGWGAKTDRDKLMSSVENLSKTDWERIHTNPNQELAKVQIALESFANPKDVATIMQRMTDKAAANTYEDSQKVGRRSIDKTFADNKTNPGNKVERLSKMNDEEREAYKTNKDGFADRVNKLVGEQTAQGLERYAAERVLQGIKDGRNADHIDAAFATALKGENASKTVGEIEAALKDNPALLARPAKSDADTKEISMLRQALDTAVEKAGFGEQVISMGEGPQAIIPGRQAEFADKIFQTGKMPIELKVQLDGPDKIARYNDIIGASAEEKQRLLKTPPPDEATKRFQDSVFGSEGEKEMLRFAIQQGKLSEADQFRAFVLGSQAQPDSLKESLAKMTPEQRQDLANEYFSKYGKLISSDVIARVPDNEKFRFRQMLAPTEPVVRQVALDLREETGKHTSAFDPLMNRAWDKTQLGAVEAQANVDRFIKQNANEIDKLTPEQKKQLLDAVGNYQTALKNYVDSKGAFAETVVDSAITVAAVGGAFFTGGTSLTLLAAVGGGGAAFRLAAMKGIEGSDFNETAENYGRQVFKGFMAAELGFVGPTTFGLKGIAKVGEGTAMRTAEGVLSRVTRQGLSETALKEGADAAKQVVARELAQVTRQGAIIGGKETEQLVQRVSAEVLKDSASATERALFEQTVRNELKEQVVTGLRNKLLNEAESYAINAGFATATSVATEVAATGVGLEDPATLWERAAGSAQSAAVGATFFHFAFKGAGAAFQGGKALLGRDSKGFFAGEGTMVRHEDGSVTVVKQNETYRFQKGDKVVENLNAERPAARSRDTQADGRPADSGRKEFIESKFQKLDEADRVKAQEAVVNDLKEVKASTVLTNAEGKPLSAYDQLMADKSMSPAQKQRVIDMLADVREHYVGYRGADGKLIGDQEVNWIHTQGELAKVLDSARVNKLSAEETENALIASMFSDSAKYTDTAITKGNFTTHHLDGALAAQEVLQQKGFPPERIKAITQAIREHQIAPPEFMGFIYQTTIARNLKAQLDSKLITQEKYEQMKKVLDDMTVVGPDKMPRIKQIADINNAPRVKNGDGEWEIGFTPEQKEVMKLSGTDHWYVPHDPRYLADGKTIDPEFKRLPPEEQARKISTYKSSRTLIDGDGIDNYATIGGASKIVKIRGPETFFADKTVWDSVKSIDKSYDDAFTVLTKEGKVLAQEALAERNKSLHDPKTGVRAQMDAWLRSKGMDPARQEIPFYNKELKYPEPLNAAEQTQLSGLRTQAQGLDKATAAPSDIANLNSQIDALKYKGLNEQQIKDFEFAKQIRDQMTDFMRQAHRSDGSLPGNFPVTRGTGDSVSMRAGSTEPLPREEYVNTGDWGKADFSKQETIRTQHLGPCVSCITKDGTLAHLNPDWQGPKQIQEYVSWLKQNAGSGTRDIALVGGMDDKGQTYRGFRSSAEMVAYLRTELKKAGFNVTFEDLYGERQRDVTLNRNGNIEIKDGWNPNYHRSFTFNDKVGTK